jgi:hypothetical protein
MYIYCVYPAMLKSPKQLPNCLKRAETSLIREVAFGEKGLVRGGLLYIFFFLLLLYGMTLTKYMIRVAMDNIYWMGCIQSNRNVNHSKSLFP